MQHCVISYMYVKLIITFKRFECLFKLDNLNFAIMNNWLEIDIKR